MEANDVTSLYPSLPRRPSGSYGKYLSGITRLGLNAPLGGTSTGNANHRYIGLISSGNGSAFGIGSGGPFDVEASNVPLDGTNILALAFRRAMYAKHYFRSCELKFPQMRVTCTRLLWISLSYPSHHPCAVRKSTSAGLNCINANGIGCII